MNQKLIAKSILLEYIIIDNHLTNNYQYYCHTEFDSNCDKFETLSNNNAIVLKTKFNPKYVPIIMNIFHNIYNQNYWYLESILDDSFTGYDLVNDNRFDILSSNNINEWLSFINELASKNEITTNRRGETFVGDELIFTNIPSSSKKQKIYTLQNILDLI
jgi:hypothetical protein